MSDKGKEVDKNATSASVATNANGRKLNSRGSGSMRKVVKRGAEGEGDPEGEDGGQRGSPVLAAPKWDNSEGAMSGVGGVSSVGAGACADEEAEPEPDDAEEEELERGAASQEAQLLERVLSPVKTASSASVGDAAQAGAADDVPVIAEWPVPLDDIPTEAGPTAFAGASSGADEWPDLSSDGSEVEQWVMQKGHMTARTVTWNLAAHAPPSIEEVRAVLLPQNKYHLYFIGTEECERSIAASAINPSKRNWELYLAEALGDLYMPLRAHTLQAMHIIVFAHRGISHLCSDLTSGCIATGLGMGVGTLGNKGAVAVNLRLAGTTTLTVVNSHLAAHQNAVKKRNEEFWKIHNEIPSVLSKRLRSRNSFVSAGSLDPAPSLKAAVAAQSSLASELASSADGKPPLHDGASTADAATAEPEKLQGGSLDLAESADRVIFMGDMNYRIRGNRTAVDNLLKLNMHEVMLSNDQLQWSRDNGHLPVEYVEAPLNFRPTYKFDFGSDVYDSDKKQRIPSWTDRVLYIPKGLTCTAYNSDNSLKTSDHRPVYASFKVQVSFDTQHAVATADDKAKHSASVDFQSKSEVCAIM